MAGFLDSKERVMDVVLTGIGKQLLLRGDLRFKYWVAFDDEVHYDQLDQESLIMEASSGYRLHNLVGDDRVNVNRPLYSIPAGHRMLPETLLNPIPTGTIEVTVQQAPLNKSGSVDQIIKRFDAAPVRLQATVTADSYGPNHVYEGVLVTVYHSSSEGYAEVLSHRDENSEVAYGPDLQIDVGG